jgi:hypothetical protein
LRLVYRNLHSVLSWLNQRRRKWWEINLRLLETHLWLWRLSIESLWLSCLEVLYWSLRKLILSLKRFENLLNWMRILLNLLETLLKCLSRLLKNCWIFLIKALFLQILISIPNVIQRSWRVMRWRQILVEYWKANFNWCQFLIKPRVWLKSIWFAQNLIILYWLRLIENGIILFHRVIDLL